MIVKRSECVGKVLRECRLRRGLSQQAIADFFGIPVQTYQNYEHGRCEPRCSFLIAFADFYGISLDHLVGRYTFPPEEIKR